MLNNILVINPVSGISGDKMISCLADLGIEETFLNKAIDNAGISAEVIVRISTEKRRGIKGTRVMFEFVSPKKRMPDEMKQLIQKSRLKDTVKKTAASIIDHLTDAEAGVHGMNRHHVHFHELSHPDTIADAVIVASALEFLGIEKILTASINVGFGSVNTDHGVYPVPPPAVSLLLEGYKWHFGVDGDGELTTPTGAAIIKALAFPLMNGTNLVHQKVGYGLGMAELATRANVLQAFLCRNRD